MTDKKDKSEKVPTYLQSLWMETDVGQLKEEGCLVLWDTKGAEVVEKITKAAGDLGVKYLTLYAFSTENWKRSEDEVSTLMGLLRDYLKKDLEEIQK